jgi:hypothetical protein
MTRVTTEQAPRVAPIADRRATPATDHRSVPSSVRWLIAVVIVSRVFITALVQFSRDRVGALSDAAPAPVARWLQPWTIFDGGLYLQIAQHGYSRTTSAFFPLYPKLIGLVPGNVTVSTIVGIAISTTAFAIAMVMLYRLVDLDYGSVTARRTVVVAAFYPFAALWSAVYTESLFLLLVTTTWWFARRRKWAAAILPALLCGLTRNAGVVLGVALALEWWQQRRETTDDTLRNSTRTTIAMIASIVAPVVGFVGVMVTAHLKFGDGGGLGAQGFFGRKLSWPWWAVWKDVSSLSSVFTIGKVFSLAAIFAATWFTIRDIRRHRFGYTFFVVGILGMHLLYARQRDPFTIGAARYLLTTFPFLISLAICTEKMSKNMIRVLMIAVIILCALGSITFGRGQFEMG